MRASAPCQHLGPGPAPLRVSAAGLTAAAAAGLVVSHPVQLHLVLLLAMTE